MSAVDGLCLERYLEGVEYVEEKGFGSAWRSGKDNIVCKQNRTIRSLKYMSLVS